MAVVQIGCYPRYRISRSLAQFDFVNGALRASLLKTVLALVAFMVCRVRKGETSVLASQVQSISAAPSFEEIHSEAQAITAPFCFSWTVVICQEYASIGTFSRLPHPARQSKHNTRASTIPFFTYSTSVGLFGSLKGFRKPLAQRAECILAPNFVAFLHAAGVLAHPTGGQGAAWRNDKGAQIMLQLL